VLERAKWLLPLAALWLWAEPLESFYIPNVTVAAGVAAVALALLPFVVRRRPRMGWAALLAAAPWLTGAAQVGWSAATGAPLRPFFGEPLTSGSQIGLMLMGHGAEASFVLLASVGAVAVVERPDPARPRRAIAATAAVGALALYLLDPLFERAVPSDVGIWTARLPLVIALAAIALAAAVGVSRAALTRGATLAFGASVAAYSAFEARLHGYWVYAVDWRPGGCTGPPEVLWAEYPAIEALEAVLAITAALAAIAAIAWLTRGRARAILPPALALLCAVAIHDAAMHAVSASVDAPELGAPLPFELPHAYGQTHYGELDVELVVHADGAIDRRAERPRVIAAESGTRWGRIRPHLGPVSDVWEPGGLAFLTAPEDAYDSRWRARWRELLPYFAHAHPTPRSAWVSYSRCIAAQVEAYDPLRIEPWTQTLPSPDEAYGRTYAITVDDDVTIDRLLTLLQELQPLEACVVTTRSSPARSRP